LPVDSWRPIAHAARMSVSARVVAACVVGAALARLSLGCGAASLDTCHQQTIEQLGCCPMCDVECREQVIGGCDDDVHDAPSVVVETGTTAASQDTTDGEPSPPSW